MVWRDGSGMDGGILQATLSYATRVPSPTVLQLQGAASYIMYYVSLDYRTIGV